MRVGHGPCGAQPMTWGSRAVQSLADRPKARMPAEAAPPHTGNPTGAPTDWHPLAARPSRRSRAPLPLPHALQDAHRVAHADTAL